MLELVVGFDHGLDIGVVSTSGLLNSQFEGEVLSFDLSLLVSKLCGRDLLLVLEDPLLDIGLQLE